MADNIRYIVTKVDKKDCILCQRTCNFCPYFDLDPHSKTTYCRNFDYKRFIKLVYSYNYVNGYFFPLTDIPIPDFCTLNRYITELSPNTKFKSSDNSIVVESIQSIKDFEIVTDKSIKYVDFKLVTDLKIPYVEEYFPNQSGEYAPYVAPTQVIKNICSCCGDDKKEVDRNKQMGMCDECFSNMPKKRNKDKLNFVYINNFRLKRKSTYSDTKFKRIKEIKI